MQCEATDQVIRTATKEGVYPFPACFVYEVGKEMITHETRQ
jgi:hypothetical protein